ncbi:jg4300, partial [Pararge aegeria aegeria]
RRAVQSGRALRAKWRASPARTAERPLRKAYPEHPRPSPFPGNIALSIRACPISEFSLAF